MRAAAVPGKCFKCGGEPAAWCPGPRWDALFYRPGVGCVAMRGDGAAAASAPIAGFTVTDNTTRCNRCGRTWSGALNSHNMLIHRQSRACSAAASYAGARAAMGAWLRSVTGSRRSPR